jgi:pimeloyl-ACP methyl ester carboxylesterase
MNSSPAPEGPGSVSGAPHLPEGFAGTFTSRYVEAGGLRQHVVTGGQGPPLLLVHGWPQTWYAWRLIMPALARDFFVVAPDQRGCGLSGKPKDGYDSSSRDGSTCTSASSSPRPRGKLPDEAVRHYIDPLAADPDALRGSFAVYARSIPPSRRTSSARNAG